jgi:hypothetical protein
MYKFFFHSRTAQHLNVIRLFYLPTDAQKSRFKNIKIYIKTAQTLFRLITIIRERISRACLWLRPHNQINRTDVF